MIWHIWVKHKREAAKTISRVRAKPDSVEKIRDVRYSILFVLGDPPDDQLEDDRFVLRVQLVVAEKLHQLGRRQLQYLVRFLCQLGRREDGNEVNAL